MLTEFYKNEISRYPQNHLVKNDFIYCSVFVGDGYGGYTRFKSLSRHQKANFLEFAKLSMLGQKTTSWFYGQDPNKRISCDTYHVASTRLPSSLAFPIIDCDSLKSCMKAVHKLKSLRVRYTIIKSSPEGYDKTSGHFWIIIDLVVPFKRCLEFASNIPGNDQSYVDYVRRTGRFMIRLYDKIATNDNQLFMSAPVLEFSNLKEGIVKDWVDGYFDLMDNILRPKLFKSIEYKLNAALSAVEYNGFLNDPEYPTFA